MTERRTSLSVVVVVIASIGLGFVHTTVMKSSSELEAISHALVSDAPALYSKPKPLFQHFYCTVSIFYFTVFQILKPKNDPKDMNDILTSTSITALQCFYKITLLLEALRKQKQSLKHV